MTRLAYDDWVNDRIDNWTGVHSEKNNRLQ